ncbi:hypothetical protein L6278_00700 [Candidatus Parcubacteria bacterium]|nr:hypothetical protein [Patescibacteria group bacterium]MBU4481942.1 hypothetical protein [Patescibacteria group bacterium]MCG2686638.1 hypothetical protein [Candidatus Parcubacteria bacterium]
MNQENIFKQDGSTQEHGANNTTLPETNPEKIVVKPEQDGSTQELGANITGKQEKQNKIKPTDWLVWLGNFIIIGAIFYVLVFFCNFQPLWLIALILADFYLLLLINYLNKFKIKKLGLIFCLLLLALPIIILIMTGAWTWWMWLLVIGFYFLTLAFYFMGVLLENYWRVAVPLSIFLILMLLFLIR